MLDRLTDHPHGCQRSAARKALICHSATTTHYSVAARRSRRASGSTDASMRISIGMEHPDDLIADLSHALEAI